MKKLLAFLMAVTMIVSMLAVSAFAAEPPASSGHGADSPNGESSSEVKVTIGNGGKTEKYAVDITFGSMLFTYTTGGSTWDTSTHQYVPVSGSWSEAQNITVANHSSASINYSASVIETLDTYGSLTITLGNESKDIARCPVGGPAPTETITVEITGTPDVSEINQQKLGTIKVAITKGA